MLMRQGYLQGFTAAEKTELWDRWRRGALKAIGRRPHSGCYRARRLARFRGGASAEGQL